jgi:hypothetical protein
MKHLFAIFIAASIAACSPILPNTQATAAPAAPPTDYQRIIRDGAPAAMTKEAQVSDLRPAIGAQQGDWFVCVKSGTKPYTGFFSVFIQDGKVKDFRRAVGVDRCESATYVPLALPPPPKKETPSKRSKVHPKVKTDKL